MNDMTLEERLDFIEFRQELLFHNSPIDRMLFSHNVTRSQSKDIVDLFYTYRKDIENGDLVHSVNYELSIGEIVPHKKHNYHFAESLALTYYEGRQFEEVFLALYGDDPKFQKYLHD